MSDWTEDEYRALLGFGGELEDHGQPEFISDADVPAEVNWVKAGAVTPVQNQGNCGSCWAFSAVGEMEGAHFLATGDLVKLSEQNCLDCSSGSSHGCSGGYQIDCYRYAEHGHMHLEKDWPYTTIVDSCWEEIHGNSVLQVKSYGIIPHYSMAQFKARLAQQPVSITMEADQDIFRFYQGGIISTKDCGINLDHALLAVGYGTDRGIDYYLVKNSWGPKWGEQGYVRIAADGDGYGICGILRYNQYAKTD